MPCFIVPVAHPVGQEVIKPTANFSPEKYEEMLETIEDHRLFVEPKKRMSAAKEDDFFES